MKGKEGKGKGKMASACYHDRDRNNVIRGTNIVSAVRTGNIVYVVRTFCNWDL